MPKYDAVLAVTSGTGDMAGVMDAVWQTLLPALRERALPANKAANDKLTKKLGSLALPPQTGTASVALGADVSGKYYSFGTNELGIKSASVDFSNALPRITFVDADGTHFIPCGIGSWVKSTTTFQKRISNVFDNDHQPLAASCGWTDDHTFTAKLCFSQTPYTITSRFTFEPNKLLIDLEHNLRWGDTKRPQLVGKR